MNLTNLSARTVAAGVEELLAGCERREAHHPSQARSSARFERVVQDGQPAIVKYVHVDTDVFMRVGGDIGCIPRRVWSAGLMDLAPAAIDHATVGVAPWGRNGWGAALLMRDVSSELIAPGDDPVTEQCHLAILDAMAALAVPFWDCPLDDPIVGGLLPVATRWALFGAEQLQGEAGLGWPEPVPRIAIDGWQRFGASVPADVADVICELGRDAAPFVAALATTPLTFLHGDWKMANLGLAGDGRVVLLDWTYCGIGPIAHELAWYLALNRARLPVGHNKESTIDDLGSALRRRGIDTARWWERQVELCLLGAVVQFGWEKALGSATELAWWVDAARRGARHL